MRDSFIFYRSFFESAKTLKTKDKLKFFESVCDYALNDIEPDLEGPALGMFNLLKPQVDANTRKYENGCKGGRPKKHDPDEATEAKKARNSSEYKDWKRSVFERDNYTCQLCGSKKDLQAHHKLDFVEFPDKRFDVDNGLTLCRSCHNKIHYEEENQEKTKNKPKNNHGESKSKRNDNDNDNDNVNVNDNDNDNYNDNGASRGGGSDNDKYNLFKILGADGIDAIYEVYPESGGFLLEKVAADVKLKRKVVKHPVEYVLGYASNVEWDDSANHFEEVRA